MPSGKRGLGQLMLGFILMTAAFAAAADASSTADLDLPRVGDEVEYLVVTPSSDWVLTLSLLPAGDCTDGLARVFSCQRLLVAWAPGPAGSWVAEFSLQHAEFVAAGNWGTGASVRQEHFARPSPLWMGFPLPLAEGGAEDFFDAHRAVMVGIVGGIRLAIHGAGTSLIAGAPTVLMVDEGLDGLNARLILPGTDVEYRMGFDSVGAWPAHIELRTEAGGSRVQAYRLGFVAGDGAVMEPLDWSPLDFPLRDGVDLAPWRKVPPDRAELFLPLSEAWLLASSSPAGLSHAFEHPESYAYRASYVESSRDQLLGLPIRWGQWSIHEASPESDVRRAIVSAMALQAAEDVRVFSLGETSGPQPRPVTPRELLPRTVTPLEDALEIASAVIPVDPGAFTFSWEVSGRDNFHGTPDALTYTLFCGAYPEWTLVWADVSAVNAQLLSRVALAPSC